MRPRIWIPLGAAFLALGVGIGYALPRLAQPLQVAVPWGRAEPSPTLSLDTYRELRLDNGGALQLWEGRAAGLRDVKVNVLLLAEGKSKTLGTIDCKGPGEKRATTWLLYLRQESEEVAQESEGVAKCRIHVPWVGCQFESPNHEYSSIQQKLDPAFAGEFVGRVQSTAPVGAIRPSEQRVVFYRCYIPQPADNAAYVYGDMLNDMLKNLHEKTTSVESLAKRTRGGIVIVAVTVEWQ